MTMPYMTRLQWIRSHCQCGSAVTARRSGLLALIALLGAASSVRAEDERPNIILIMVDDMGFSDIGCYGGEIDTPHIDRLAAEGVRFTQFYNTGRCCPTRASLLTGLYAHQAGIGHMTSNYGHPGYIGRLNDRCVTIAEALQSSGYTTMFSGKWHVGADREFWPDRRGFERTYGIPQGGGVYFRLKSGRSLILDGQEIAPPEDWYCTDAFTNYAIRFIRENQSTEKPFFLYLAHIAPHWPLKAKPEDIAKYRGRYTQGWDAVRHARFQRQMQMGLRDATWPLAPRDASVPAWDDAKQHEELDLRMAVYAAQVDCMDQNVGRLLDVLDELRIADNTMVMFLSDNGGCAEGGVRGFGNKGKGPIGSVDSHASYGRGWANASNTPFRLYKHWVHEGGIATPLVVRWPARISDVGSLRRAVGHVIDLMPTCLDAAGADYPTSHAGRAIQPLEGVSLLPVLDGETPDRGPLFWEHEGNRAVRIGDWKLVSEHGKPWELYELSEDRTELNDVASKHPERVDAMQSKYDQWAERAGVQPWPVKRTK